MKIQVICSISLSLVFYNLCFAHDWMAPEDVANRENPIPISSVSIEQGRVLFLKLCASCHGINAVGIPKETTGLSKDTPNLPSRLSMHTDADFHWKILNGKGEMPSFFDELSERDGWNIVNYIRSKIKQ